MHRRLAIAIVLLQVVTACSRQPSDLSSAYQEPSHATGLKAPTADSTDQLTDSYFPLADGVKYEFVGKYEQESYRSTLLLRKYANNGRTFYYFITDDGNTLLTGCMCGLGIYGPVEGGIKTAKVSWLDELDRAGMGGAQLMLRLLPKTGDITLLTDGDNKLRFEVEGFEDVVVPAGSFKDCVKIGIRDTWPDKEYTARIWLARGIGLVKWHLATGRIDELASFTKTSQ